MHYIFIIFAVIALTFTAVGALSVWSFLLFLSLKFLLLLIPLIAIGFIVRVLHRRFQYGKQA